MPVPASPARTVSKAIGSGQHILVGDFPALAGFFPHGAVSSRRYDRSSLSPGSMTSGPLLAWLTGRRQTRLGTAPVKENTTRMALWPGSAVGSNMHGPEAEVPDWINCRLLPLPPQSSCPGVALAGNAAPVRQNDPIWSAARDRRPYVVTSAERRISRDGRDQQSSHCATVGPEHGRTYRRLRAAEYPAVRLRTRGHICQFWTSRGYRCPVVASRRRAYPGHQPGPAHLVSRRIATMLGYAATVV
jgi:hypothetical protein